MEDKVQETNKQCEHMPKRPILTTFASIVWIIFGVLSLLGIIMIFLTVFVLTNSNEMKSSSPLFVLFLVALPAILGVVFTYMGVQTIKGKALDVVGNSIGSILIGMLYLFVGIQRDSVTNIRTYRATLFLIAMLVVAGILALIGRSRYKVWRNARIQKAEDNKVAEKLEE